MTGTEPTWALFREALPTIYRDPIITAAAAGAVLGFMGVYVVTRRMVFISAALSQVSGLGVALAFFLPMVFGDLGLFSEPIVLALGLSLAATFLFRLDPARLGLTRDALLGLTYVLAGAVAVIIGTRISQEAHDIQSILFGTAVAVRDVDLWLTLGVGGGLLALHILLVRGLALVSFDPVAAQVQGLPVAWLDGFLFVSIAVVVAITTRALGALPVFAFTVLPAMGALAVSRHLGRALWVATGIGAFSGALGYVYSFFLRFPVGASQATVAGVCCVAFMGTRIALNRDLIAVKRLSAAVSAAAVVLLATLPFYTTTGEGYQGHHHGDGPLTGLDQPPVADAPGSAGEIADLIAVIDGTAAPEAKAQAARRLGHLHASEAKPALVRLLHDSDWGVRAEAAEAIGHMGGEVPEGLIETLRKDSSSWVREAAVGALCHYHAQPTAKAALGEAAAKDPDPVVRNAARRHLGEPCPHDPGH